MFNFDWDIHVITNVPIEKRDVKRLELLKVCVSQIKSIHAEFYAWITLTLYYSQFNGQIIYLEHVLNDLFDYSLRRIYIDNTADNSARTYIFNAVESQQPTWIFNAWNAVDAFLTDDHVSFDLKIYKALSNNTNTNPVSNLGVWQYVMEEVILFNEADFALYNNDFIVMVPTGLVFDMEMMKAVVNKFKLAGKQYTIQFY